MPEFPCGEVDGSKLVLDESGGIVRTLARGERLQVSKRDRSRLVLSSAERVELVRRIFAMSAVDERCRPDGTVDRRLAA